ncbi:DsbA family protein [Solirubrobacter phytolaccae]|uniref:DsbA family protein n=1 Tax=Solirubrobacter phytolaccae TaxID=1404360 RepID=A0A9X3NDK0_9ACTN|nr:DsbA family protein [Solirubrobacter phytolaccae]MDA0184139.1 DsbA family protein [Solirubrobacter phytolaccae]
MTEFQAYEHTDINSATAFNAEPVLRRVRHRYEGRAWWRRVFGSCEPSPLVARAARAAEHQGAACAEAVLKRLREATFVDRTPVDDVSALAAALADVPGLDVSRLIRDLESPDVVWSVDADRSLTRRRGGGEAPCPYPTVLFRGPGGDRVVTGPQPFEAYVEAIEAVAPALRGVRPLAEAA